LLALTPHVHLSNGLEKSGTGLVRILKLEVEPPILENFDERLHILLRSWVEGVRCCGKTFKVGLAVLFVVAKIIFFGDGVFTDSFFRSSSKSS
jgi:hypothetical protein